jgi:hypothetical protein
MLGLDHFICQKDGTWLNMNDYASESVENITFNSGNRVHANDNFNCKFNNY